MAETYNFEESAKNELDDLQQQVIDLGRIRI